MKTKKMYSSDYDVLNVLLNSDDFISMSKLSERVGFTKRYIRRSIEAIILNEPDIVIVINEQGYKLARTEEELKEANRLQRARTKASIEKLIANGPDNTAWLYNLITELRTKYKVIPEGQQDIDGKEKTYYGESKY